VGSSGALVAARRPRALFPTNGSTDAAATPNDPGPCGTLRGMNTEWDDEADGLDFEIDPEVQEQWLEEWDEAERDALEVLRSALDSYRGQPAPENQLSAAASAVRERLHGDGGSLEWVGQAAGLGDDPVPDDDAELLIRLASATISPEEETGLEVEEESILLSLELGDWLGAIISVVRGGPGANAGPDALVDGIRNCPEVVLETDLDVDDESHLNAAFWIVAVPWELLGIVDRDHRLTELGEWVLPRALARAWNGDFDRESDPD
jgi:hypothetical protein